MPIFSHSHRWGRAASRVRPRIRQRPAKILGFKRRRFRRSRLPIRILTTVGAHSATLTRVTLYDACLVGGRRLRRREIVALRLPSGQRVKARVRWRLGARCGVTFMSPVADFARLLCEVGAILPSPRRQVPATSPPRRRSTAAARVWRIDAGDGGRLLHRIAAAVLTLGDWILSKRRPAGPPAMQPLGPPP